ncbi:MAG: hypothetical protein OJF51_002883 [Nitrospira sp.]|jgi:hypothetical protein|nr:MAG: hypothetical protein OJF51_002883 [Nitrospira sp.]
MTDYELHPTHRHINKIKHMAVQSTAKPSKKSANLQPDAKDMRREEIAEMSSEFFREPW